MKRIITAIAAGLVFIAFTLAVKLYDVNPIGPVGTEVGFSHINQRAQEAIGVHMNWYDITDYLGYAVLAICGVFALAGLVQLIKRRSLMKVDREILLLGLHFAVVIAFYVLFEIIVINYRPILLEGETMPEPSYPSSHTMLVVSVMIAVAMIIGRYVKSGPALAFIRIICVLVTLVMVGGRLYSGAHWLTDIIGGLLLSIALLLAFNAALGMAGKESEPRQGRDTKAYSARGYKPKH